MKKYYCPYCIVVGDLIETTPRDPLRQHLSDHFRQCPHCVVHYSGACITDLDLHLKQITETRDKLTKAIRKIERNRKNIK